MPNPAAHTFRDSFSTSVVSACWSDFSFSGGSATGGHPGLVLAKGAGDFSGGWLQTADLYDLTGAGGGSAATIEITSLPADPGGSAANFAFFQFLCGVVGDSGVEFDYYPHNGAGGGPTRLEILGDGPLVTLTGTIPLFWRFRGLGDGSTIYADTSDDGIGWTARNQWNAGPPHVAGAATDVQFDLLSQYCTTTVATYNGGGPGCGCPSFPCPPPAARARCWSIE